MDILQRSLGNAGFARLVTSSPADGSASSGGVVARKPAAPKANWGSKELEGKDEETGWAERFSLMNGWSLDYMLETADVLKKSGRLTKYLEQVRLKENTKDIFAERIIATLKTADGAFDAEYYTCMLALKPVDQGGFAVLLHRAGKAVSAARIDASLPQLAIRWLERQELEAAGTLLDQLPMAALLDVMPLINATGQGARARDPKIHKVPARAQRIALASTLADWAVSPDKWADFEATVRGQIGALDPSDSVAVAVWVSNKPELAHLAEVGQDLLERGQFAFGQELYGTIWDKIHAEGGKDEQIFIDAIGAAANRDAPDFNEKQAAAAKLAADSYAGLKSVFGAKALSKKRGLAIYEAVWAEFEKTRTYTSLSRFLNMYDLHSLAIAEADRCNAQVRHTHALHTNLGGSTPTGPEPKLAANGLVSDIKQHRRPKVEGPWRGSQVVFVGNLGAVVASMKAVLDSKRRIIAGVLSGATGGMTPEHYLYIIGYRGNSFICADSDPGNEQSGRMPISGVTYLYYDAAANRLSTAVTDDDFPIRYIERPDAKPTDSEQERMENRFQMNGPHRYQALMVSVLPSK
ncbi:MAG: hypothetical protein AB7T32_13415 [Dehalococcoidia bacterium]